LKKTPPPIKDRSFAPFAETLLKGGGLEDILQTIHNLSGFDCAFKLNSGKLHVFSRNTEFFEQIKTYPHRELLRIFHHTTVSQDDSVVGTLILNRPREEPSSPTDLLENATLALRLLLNRKHSELKVEQRYRDHCVQDLLFSRIRHPDELENRASLFGWDLSGSVTAVVAMAVDTDPEDRIRQTICHRLRAFYPKLIFADVGHHLALLIPSSTNGSKEIFETCRYVRDEIAPLKVRLGIGDPRSSFIDAGESYREACQAIEIMDRFLKDWAIARWSELGAYKLLSTLAQKSDGVDFMRQKLSPLVEYDKTNNTELMATLLAIDRGNWNLRTAADSLYVHYNTVKYRFKRICEVLSLDLDDNEQRFAVSLSLRIFLIHDSFKGRSGLLPSS